MSAHTSRRLAWSLWAASSLLLAGSLALDASDGRGVRDVLALGIVQLSFASVGLVLVLRVPRNPISWLFLGLGVAEALAGAADAYAAWALGQAAPGGAAAAVAASALGGPLTGAALAALLLLFPDGRLPSPRWRVPAAAEACAAAAFLLLSLVAPGALNGVETAENPIGIGGTAGTVVLVAQTVAFAVLLVLMVASAVSLVRRFRRATGALRQQLKWFGGAAALIALAFVCGPVLWNVPASWASAAWLALFTLATTTLPIATGVAILRYRLYEIDVIVRRTLVYATLASSLALVYLAGISLIGRAVQALTGQSGALAVTLSTLAVAALFQPLRRRIQRAVDRRFYRNAYDAQRTLEGFAAHLREQVELDPLRDEVLDVVARTVQPQHATLWLRADAEAAGR